MQRLLAMFGVVMQYVLQTSTPLLYDAQYLNKH